MKLKKQNYIYAVGRRRSASARVRLHKGNLENTINSLVIGKYFPGEVARVIWSKPFELTQTSNKYYVTVKVVGGGKNGQLEAVVLGISRALALVNDKFRPILKKAGLLTRDSRIRERRKVGMGGKSRRQKQSPKR
ncbi:30S ribosomal protein S9 [Candidatus Woesebacteria bacterium RIFCSPHIGHO2_02_FULL_38_9]|uniref:30S ribosomal protein S9 n=1 Tax=Candidatus Woesebacteria bacterium RIFCSPHIGHO2_01_FULL_39_28 TaxID=1802496 RepID=A0A1F7YAK6_9BACT|nr:MAG: 30S ribosomal protein S9 [Candidatus Woesebacteria bacterium RIFCSPHIGHO2_01_FULL_39_28]OGM32224.1 MAG: 30S ribosomal protein S9 [Candidatus Woesebacteria bacterium RIFCSPHIGHO2_02_FULL_38_9]OGM58448.1 MAG: 30S ribosomal protein S9 [Candidatus Woesebacteria bacterium RIFCSPLOWO2_01_FULL_38_20]